MIRGYKHSTAVQGFRSTNDTNSHQKPHEDGLATDSLRQTVWIPRVRGSLVFWRFQEFQQWFQGVFAGGGPGDGWQVAAGLARAQVEDLQVVEVGFKDSWCCRAAGIGGDAKHAGGIPDVEAAGEVFEEFVGCVPDEIDGAATVEDQADVEGSQDLRQFGIGDATRMKAEALARAGLQPGCGLGITSAGVDIQSAGGLIGACDPFDKRSDVCITERHGSSYNEPQRPGGIDWPRTLWNIEPGLRRVVGPNTQLCGPQGWMVSRKQTKPIRISLSHPVGLFKK